MRNRALFFEGNSLMSVRENLECDYDLGGVCMRKPPFECVTVSRRAVGLLGSVFVLLCNCGLGRSVLSEGVASGVVDI